MCDVDYGDRADVWLETKPKARKVHPCIICGGRVFKGEVYFQVETLFDGSWARLRGHMTCVEITKFIAFDVCSQEVWFFGSDSYDLRENVREHMGEDPEVLRMYRDHLRDRRRVGRGVPSV